ncbi:hypothetical protein OQI_37515, partial [Streptomyces pharetrae CZA14]
MVRLRREPHHATAPPRRHRPHLPTPPLPQRRRPLQRARTPGRPGRRGAGPGYLPLRTGAPHPAPDRPGTVRHRAQVAVLLPSPARRTTPRRWA